ncbi:MAG: site-specific integrase [Thermoplasmata archaeon]
MKSPFPGVMLGSRRGRSRPARSTPIESDPAVERWFRNQGRGSKATGDVYLRRLRSVCERIGRTPAELASLDPKAAYDVLLDFVSAEEARGATGSYISHSVAVVRSWLAFNGRPVVQRVKIRGADRTPTLENERTPTSDELGRVLRAAPPQWRAAAAVLAFGGVRPEVLGSYDGTDGLILRDLPDLRVEGGAISFGRAPAIVVVRPELSKAGHRFFTFLGAEACGYIAEYLAMRARSGEELGPDSDLIHPLRAAKRFIRTVNIGDGIRSAIRRAGFDWRPYVLRAYFDTQLLLAESKGLVAHDYRVFWMGHKGSMEARYTTNKGRLPPNLVDDMREAYRRCEPTLTGKGPSEGEVRTEVARVLLESLGYTENDLDGVDLSDVEQVRALTQNRIAPAPKRQALVGVDELPRYLDAGWTFAGNIGQDRILLNPPTAAVGVRPPARPIVGPAGSTSVAVLGTGYQIDA